MSTHDSIEVILHHLVGKMCMSQRPTTAIMPCKNFYNLQEYLVQSFREPVKAMLT